jgi:L-threonylcarbamoyladenylate synthase
MNQIEQAIKILKAGGVVVYPTDTAYGLAVDATNVKAVEKLYAVKGRDFNKPVHVIYPDTKWLQKIVELNIQALRLMDKFLPGPLTIVSPLKAKGESWKKLSAGTKTMGTRLPNHQIALELVKKFGKPITTTSANVSGMPPCYSTAEARLQFENVEKKPDFYLEGGKLRKLMPSTVVSLIDGHVKIIRPGPITEKQIKASIK